MIEVMNKFEKSKRDSNRKPVDSSYNPNIDSPKCTSIILKPALDIKNNDQNINNYTIIVTKTDEKIIVDEENAKSIKEDRMLETSVTHCKTNKNIDGIGKVTRLGNVAQKIKNVASTETIDDKNLNDSVSINNHINTDNSNRSDEGSNHAERFTILHPNVENNNNSMKMKKKLEYFTTNTDLRESKTNEVSNSCVFIKDRSLTQNRNNNTSVTKLSPFILSQSYHIPRKKPTIVNDMTFQMTDDLLPSNKLETVEIIDNNVVTKVIISQSNHSPTQKTKKGTAKNIQMNYLDEKYSSAGNTNIYNDGSKEININSSRSREKSNQDEIFNHRQCNVDHNKHMILKKKVDYNTNNNDRANLKTNEGCNKSKCNKIKTQNPNNSNTNIANTNSMVSPFVTSSINNIVPWSLKKHRKKEVINKLERRKRNLNSKPVDSLYNTNIDTPKCN